MEKSFAAFTFFTSLLFAVSTARIPLESPATYLPAVRSSDDASKSILALPEPADVAGDSNIILPTDKLKSKDDESDNVMETEKSRMFRVDLTPRSDFARFHAINRHFLDDPRISLRPVHRRPHRRSVNPMLIPRSERSQRKEYIVSGETGNVDLEHIHHQAPLKRMKLRHDYGHHHHRNQHHRLHHGNNDVSTPKHMSDREMNGLLRQHKGKKRPDETDFMKSIRKFLKHTFE